MNVITVKIQYIEEEKVTYILFDLYQNYLLLSLIELFILLLIYW